MPIYTILKIYTSLARSLSVLRGVLCSLKQEETVSSPSLAPLNTIVYPISVRYLYPEPANLCLTHDKRSQQEISWSPEGFALFIIIIIMQSSKWYHPGKGGPELPVFLIAHTEMGRAGGLRDSQIPRQAHRGGSISLGNWNKGFILETCLNSF